MSTPTHIIADVGATNAVRGGSVTRIAQVVLLADANLVSTGTLGALVRGMTFSADMAPP